MIYCGPKEDDVIILFNSDTETKKMIDELLKKGEYVDVSQLIAIAIANQHVMEFSESAITGRVDPGGSDRKRSPNRINTAIGDVPRLFRLEGPYDEIPLVEVKPSTNQQEYDVSEWLFGQYNRLLPAKASCRAIINLWQSGQSIPLEQVSARIAEQAAVLGHLLRSIDERDQVDRYDALAIAFPEEGPEAHKSRSRYQNQFVGSLSGEGELNGLLAELKLVVLDPSAERIALRLTDIGAQFAEMPNPILDTPGIGGDRFSQSEIRLLLSHIEASVPREASAFKSILRGLVTGYDNPKELDAFLRDQELTSSEFTDSFLSSQRSGAISRMTDLALVKRERDGIRVRYIATAKGQELLQRMEKS